MKRRPSLVTLWVLFWLAMWAWLFVTGALALAPIPDWADALAAGANGIGIAIIILRLLPGRSLPPDSP